MIAHPPVIYAASIAVGLGLHYLWPTSVVPGAWGAVIGPVLVLFAVVVFVSAVRQMLAAGTQVPTNRPSACVVTAGPYRFTRNPIYLSFTVAHLGIAAWVNSLWLVAVLPVTLVVMSRGVIAREERYLAKKFGQAYLGYKSAVRRWL